MSSPSSNAVPDGPLSARGLRLATRRTAKPLGALGLALYNALYWPYLLASCALLFIPALTLFAVTAPWDRKRRLLRRYTGAWGRHYLTCAPFADVSVEGASLPPSPCIYVSNHQSMVDILALFALRVPFLWVSKWENFLVPFLGWNMALNGYIPLKRGFLPSILRMVRLCQRRLEEGYDLFVFPEGTRSPDGNLRAFHRGAFFLAAKYDVPVVPVVVRGTRGILAKGSMRISPGPVRLEVLPAVHPAEVAHDSRKLRDEVARRMLERLRDRPVSEPAAAA